jgi:TRAP-type C4-dicarboxylate transport system permease small subunit
MTSARRGTLRRALDFLYTGCGILAGAALVAIATCVLIQICARLLGLVVPWTAEFAGYAMAACSFLALASTFNTGGHIRVDLLLARLPDRARHTAEILCLVLANIIIGYFAWFIVLMTWQSYKFNDVGQGTFAVPLWIPQAFMALGIVALAILLADNLVRFLVSGTTSYPRDDAQPSTV